MNGITTAGRLNDRRKIVVVNDAFGPCYYCFTTHVEPGKSYMLSSIYPSGDPADDADSCRLAARVVRLVHRGEVVDTLKYGKQDPRKLARGNWAEVHAD